MDGISTADGFVEVNNNLAEMIKYVANEPSVGLYYVQQHTHNALPNLLRLQDRIADRSREATLHTQDLEESIVMVDSMKQCGRSIADDMLNDIKKSILLMSTSQPKRGLETMHICNFQSNLYCIFNLKYSNYVFVFSSSGLLQLLQNLQQIVVADCDELEELIEGGDNKNTETPTTLPKLKRLEFEVLPKLKSIWRGVMICDSLEEVWHHTQGHAFELVTSCRASPVPIYPDDTSEDAEDGLVAVSSQSDGEDEEELNFNVFFSL
ncbi:hypothetical protein AQUCO_10100001v1 [Aquilegia coerulea]|uniref:Disease resistance protein At4g27190-like leucine-rich repeats domain-containing protein n=1 Tax=Aquilegia coerulea TaxID=218851 RepID=A0A2G5C430_AQUCA|nr:hypothetical protein AQUCO_10100001v1 [Aquilegia coerulea]